MRRFIFISIISLLFVTVAVAQRRITPVELPEYSISSSENEKPKKDSVKRKKPKSLIMGLDKDSMDVDSATVVMVNDSTSRIIYPLFNGVTIGVNIWDPVMRALGQEYGLVDFSAEVDLYNRFFPAVEIGLGAANATPDFGNFTYKSPMSVFMKVGGGYNFLHGKNADYKLIGGFRIGFSSFNYEIVDAEVGSDYWDDYNDFNILDQHSAALWGELNLGVKVRVYRDFSMGWMLRIQRMFTCSHSEYSTPGYIPGFGKSSAGINGSFYLYYTIPLKSKNGKSKSKAKEIENVIDTEMKQSLLVPTQITDEE